MKKTIIISSVIISIFALIAVLFSAVFCLREQSVTFIDKDIIYTKEAIVSAGGLQNGESIFMLDKDKAIENIESAFPEIKVVQITTLDLMSIDIRVKLRYRTYYVEKSLDEGSVYCVLDEELKILDIVSTEPTDLIAIDGTLIEDVEKGDFVLLEHQEVLKNLYISIYTTKLTSEGEQSHIDMCGLVDSVSFDTGYTLSGEYDRLIIKTRFGIQFDIGEPASNLEYKINVCFSSLSNEDIDDTSGVIRVYYDADGIEHFGYFANID